MLSSALIWVETRPRAAQGHVESCSCWGGQPAGLIAISLGAWPGCPASLPPAGLHLEPMLPTSHGVVKFTVHSAPGISQEGASEVV